MSFSFAPDNDRDLVVGIQSIVSTEQDGTTHDLLPTGINAYIDSTIPQLWLPLEACKAFEKAFGLTYDADNEIYPVSNALHEKLVARNASVTFTLGNSNSGGRTIDITLPFDSFDLQAQPPFTANATKYFPLQRAANETQYTLGRTFLQEAYLTVDWERGNFSVSQCLFDPEVTQEELVSIRSVNATSASHDQGSSSNSKTIGIAVGAVGATVVLAGAIAACCILRRRKRKRQTEKAGTRVDDDEAERIRQGFAKAELDTNGEHARYEIGDVDGRTGKKVHEAWVDEKGRCPGLHAELVGDGSRAELTGSSNGASELSSREKLSGSYHEMFDPSIPAVELPADMPGELPASPVPTFSRSSNSSRSFRSANMSPIHRSNRPSLLHHPSGGRYAAKQRRVQLSPSSASRAKSSGSQSSVSSPSAQASRTPSSPGLSGPSSPREHEPFSPISPIGGNDDDTNHQGLFSSVRGLSEPTDPPSALSLRCERREASSRTQGRYDLDQSRN